jgi:1-acyl-sn-glycerol-3-phosphate acyltransferase
MRAGEHILVFPGGGREVMRRKGEAHRLIWKQRAGFARLAIEHGYDIIPFGAVGADDNYRILVDANDVMASPLWRWLAARTPIDAATRNGEALPPLVRGIGPTLIPRPQAYYFGFGPRIETASLRGCQNDRAAVWQMRERVEEAVSMQIDSLLKRREVDRIEHWPLWRRWLVGSAN